MEKRVDGIMGNRKHLVCWEENNQKRWDMIEEQDNNSFLMNLLQNSNVEKHTIFVIPCSGFVKGSNKHAALLLFFYIYLQRHYCFSHIVFFI